MVTDLIDQGRLKYNGIDFAIYHSDVNAEAVYDDARRTVVGMKLTINVPRCYILAEDGDGETTEDQMEDFQARFMQAGGVLVLQNKGFGFPLVVNTPDAGGGEIRDLRDGPLPLYFRWTPIGDARAALVSCAIETTIPRCPGRWDDKRLMAWNFSTSTSWDDVGKMVRTVSGYVEIGMSRRPDQNGRLDNHIDRYKELAEPALIEGFRRTRREWNVDPSKRRATFVVTDEQQRDEAVLPAGVPRAEVRHRMRNTAPMVGINWDATITANITVDPRQPKWHAYRVFLAICQDRLLRVRGGRFEPRLRPGLPGPDGNLGPPTAVEVWVAPPVIGPGSARVIVKHLEVEDDATGWGTNFTLHYTVISQRRVQDLILGSGMWRRLPGADPGRFTASLRNSAYAPRGPLNWREPPDQDIIINLCSNNHTTGMAGAGAGPDTLPPLAADRVQELFRGVGQQVNQFVQRAVPELFRNRG